MKKLIIPEKVENGINISEITSDFRGLLICYKCAVPVGYLIWDEYNHVWIFTYSTDISYIHPDLNEDESLLNVVKRGLEIQVFDEVRVLEFDV